MQKDNLAKFGQELWAITVRYQNSTKVKNLSIIQEYALARAKLFLQALVAYQ